MKLFALMIVLLACSVAAGAQNRTLSGVVTNGTTHQPASGDDVILLKLGQGMEEEARTKTDAQKEAARGCGGRGPYLSGHRRALPALRPHQQHKRI